MDVTMRGGVMDLVQVVVSAVAGLIVVAVALIVTGVAMLGGLAWALITAGVLLAVGASVSGWLLLRDGDRR